MAVFFAALVTSQSDGQASDPVQTPQRFTPSAEARPVWTARRPTAPISAPATTGNAFQSAGPRQPLRWQAPQLKQAEAAVAPPLSAEPVASQASWPSGSARQPPNVPQRITISDEPPSPFDDPFGDYSTPDVAAADYSVLQPPALSSPGSAPMVQPGGASEQDPCAQQYRNYQGPDRDCLIARCRLRNNTIYGISLQIDPRKQPGFDPMRDKLPYECTLGDVVYTGRYFVPTTFTWKASALCHKPLYFEDIQLERYGHTAGPLLQPALSTAHFFGSIAVLPYKMGIHPPNECCYALGYYRPGSCAPWLLEPVPLSLRGALLQTGAVLGAVYTIP